jgi:hypothetical protein
VNPSRCPGPDLSLIANQQLIRYPHYFELTRWDRFPYGEVAFFKKAVAVDLHDADLSAAR